MKNGGSFYLQSKIFRAHEALEKTFEPKMAEMAEKAAKSAAGKKPSGPSS